jgi:hypothetical protein
MKKKTKQSVQCCNNSLQASYILGFARSIFVDNKNNQALLLMLQCIYLVALHWPIMTMVSELLLSSSSPAGFQMLLTSSSSSSVLCEELFKFAPCISNDLTWHNARA